MTFYDSSEHITEVPAQCEDHRDYYSLNCEAPNGVRLELGDGVDSAYVSTDVFVPVSMLGGPGDDELSGNDQPNTFFGEDGNDVLKGSGGDDVLDGGAGNDTLDGYSGSIGSTAVLGTTCCVLTATRTRQRTSSTAARASIASSPTTSPAIRTLRSRRAPSRSGAGRTTDAPARATTSVASSG